MTQHPSQQTSKAQPDFVLIVCNCLSLGGCIENTNYGVLTDAQRREIQRRRIVKLYTEGYKIKVHVDRRGVMGLDGEESIVTYIEIIG
jgi:hypothetical protein